MTRALMDVVWDEEVDRPSYDLPTSPKRTTTTPTRRSSG